YSPASDSRSRSSSPPGRRGSWRTRPASRDPRRREPPRPPSVHRLAGPERRHDPAPPQVARRGHDALPRVFERVTRDLVRPLRQELRSVARADTARGPNADAVIVDHLAAEVGAVAHGPDRTESG